MPRSRKIRALMEREMSVGDNVNCDKSVCRVTVIKTALNGTTLDLRT
jgi:hypothetical protein